MKKLNFYLKLKTKMIELYNKNKRVFICCVGLIVALIFLLCSIIFSTDKKTKTNNKNSIENSSISVSQYASSIENKLKSMILSLESVNNVSVFVMVDSAPTIKYLTETNTETKTQEGITNSTVSETVVFEKNGSVSTPVVVTTIMPKVTGVLIVTNKIDSLTKISIINSVGVVLNIDESCISILQER